MYLGSGTTKQNKCQRKHVKYVYPNLSWLSKTKYFSSELLTLCLSKYESRMLVTQMYASTMCYAVRMAVVNSAVFMPFNQTSITSADQLDQLDRFLKKIKERSEWISFSEQLCSQPSSDH